MTDHVAYTLDHSHTWERAEREVDELNGDSGDTVAWIVETWHAQSAYEAGDHGVLYTLWHEEGDETARDAILAANFRFWEVKYP